MDNRQHTTKERNRQSNKKEEEKKQAEPHAAPADYLKVASRQDEESKPKEMLVDPTETRKEKPKSQRSGRLEFRYPTIRICTERQLQRSAEASSAKHCDART